MSNDTHLTVTQVAKIYGVPAWRIRRLVDSLGIEIPRAGLYRLIQRDLLGTIAVELDQRGWLPRGEAQEAGSPLNKDDLTPLIQRAVEEGTNGQGRHEGQAR